MSPQALQQHNNARKLYDRMRSQASGILGLPYPAWDMLTTQKKEEFLKQVRGMVR
jgi:hypothetical protein